MSVQFNLAKWNPYLVNDDLKMIQSSKFLQMCENEPKFEYLKRFLQQHYHYSQNFVKYLCCLLSNINDHDVTASLADNLVEELGLTSDHSVAHIKLYQKMMSDLKISTDSPVMKEIQQLIDSMIKYTRNDDPVYGLSALCLGAEAIVPLIYEKVFTALKKIGYTDDELYFLKLHIECDEDHADVMKDILDKYIGEDIEKISIVRSTVSRVINERVKFMDSLIDQNI